MWREVFYWGCSWKCAWIPRLCPGIKEVPRYQSGFRDRRAVGFGGTGAPGRGWGGGQVGGQRGRVPQDRRPSGVWCLLCLGGVSCHHSCL